MKNRPSFIRPKSPIKGGRFLKVKIITLEDAIFLIEHQATINLNMALRMLLYVAKEYESYFTNPNIYSTKLIKIPKPYFYVFYNGSKKQPTETTIKLSDAFPGEYGTIKMVHSFLY